MQECQPTSQCSHVYNAKVNLLKYQFQFQLIFTSDYDTQYNMYSTPVNIGMGWTIKNMLCTQE